MASRSPGTRRQPAGGGAGGYYGNYDTSSHRLKHSYGKLEKNADLRYGYTARNSDGSKSKAALVRQADNPIGWFFVRRGCVSLSKPPS